MPLQLLFFLKCNLFCACSHSYRWSLFTTNTILTYTPPYVQFCDYKHLCYITRFSFFPSLRLVQLICVCHLDTVYLKMTITIRYFFMKTDYVSTLFLIQVVKKRMNSIRRWWRSSPKNTEVVFCVSCTLFSNDKQPIRIHTSLHIPLLYPHQIYTTHQYTGLGICIHRANFFLVLRSLTLKLFFAKLLLYQNP